MRSHSRRASRPTNGLTRAGYQFGASVSRKARTAAATAGLRWPEHLRAVQILDGRPSSSARGRSRGGHQAHAARPPGAARCAMSGLTNSWNSSHPLWKTSSTSLPTSSAGGAMGAATASEPPVGDQLGAGHEGVVVRHEEDGESGDLLRGAEPPERALARRTRRCGAGAASCRGPRPASRGRAG